jgi:DNA-binding LacI/PurR family transcriptional regulator
MVSMKDIAKACDVSVATVSKALSGQQDIGEETRKRIARKAEELGYMANASARALKTNRTYNIGVLFVDPMHGGLAHEFFSGVLDGIREEAEKNGYDITFINSSVGKRPSTYLQHCLYRGVDGVVIATADFADPMVLELVNSDLPVVPIDHMFNDHASVISDNLRGMDALVRYVVSMGHRDLALIHGEKTTVTTSRLTGFYRACEELGIRVREDMVRESKFHDPEGCARITKEILSLPERPTCIFFPDDYSCIGGYNAIREAGLRVPEDISAVGYDGIPLSRILSPVLTTWRQDSGGLGKTAAARLIEQIEHPKTAILDREIISGKLQEGASVLRIPRKTKG